MKLHIDESPVYSSGNIEKKEFKITASAKAFKILSSNLYTNKIRAIIRELSTNALDAHIAAGNPERQFEVHIPSGLDPVFWIRDYGIGMSQDQVMNLYTTYFESTKAESNDFVGALGLGSKSPFSYVDSFMVTSFYNGTKTIYDMSLSNGVPSVAILHSCETDEENGLHISVSVNTDDITRFAMEAEYVYKTFSIKPILSGKKIDDTLNNVTVYPYYVQVEDKTYANGVYAIMGNIAYRIGSQINLPDVIRTFASSTRLFFYFELGELDITPSREELSYDDETIKTLNDKLTSCEKVIKADILKKYDGINDIRLAYSKAQSEISVARNCVINHLTINGKTLGKWESILKWTNQLPNYHRVGFKLFKVNLGFASAFNEGSRYSCPNLASISRENLTLLINDDKKTPKQTLLALEDNNQISHYETGYIFEYTTDDQKMVVDNLLKMWKDTGGTLKVFWNSELTKLKSGYAKKVKKSKPASDKGPVQSAGEFVLNPDNSVSYNKLSYYASDFKEYDGVYACIFFDDYVDPDTNSVILQVETIKAIMKTTGLSQVLVVRKPNWKTIKSNPNAKIIFEFINETLAAHDGRNVGLSRPPEKSGLPKWVHIIHENEPKLAQKILGYKHKAVKHQKYFDMFFALSNCKYGKLKCVCNDDAKKQLNKFDGAFKAINIANVQRSSNIKNKYPLISDALKFVYGYSCIKDYLPEIRKILK